MKGEHNMAREVDLGSIMGPAGPKGDKGGKRRSGSYDSKRSFLQRFECRSSAG